MFKLSASEAKRNFGQLLMKAQREPIIISKNFKDSAVVMSFKNYQELEDMKTEYLKLCFESAKEELTQGDTTDGDHLFKTL